MRITNPDSKGRYPVWHYCLVCGRRWSNSPEDVRAMSNHDCVVKWGWSIIRSEPYYVQAVEVSLPLDGFRELVREYCELLDSVSLLHNEKAALGTRIKYLIEDLQTLRREKELLEGKRKAD